VKIYFYAGKFVYKSSVDEEVGLEGGGGEGVYFLLGSFHRSLAFFFILVHFL
jgi:hypothetical protein